MNICLTCRHCIGCPPHDFVVGYCSKYALDMKIGTPVIFTHNDRRMAGIFNGDNQVVAGDNIYSCDDMEPIELEKDIIEQLEK